MKRKDSRAILKKASGKKRQKLSSEVENSSSPTAVTEAWTYDSIWDNGQISYGWHERNIRFWRAQAANVRGATGGGVSQRDLAFTRAAVDELVKKRDCSFKRALDCGAGIGRVTDAILRKCCAHVDLVEFVKKHLDKAREKLPLSGKGQCSFAFHNTSMQKFSIAPAQYDLIWCQWLLMYLTDEDALSLLLRAGKGLTTDGVLLVKENISTEEKSTYFDAADGELWEEDDAQGPVSCVRTSMHYWDLFDRAGLKVVDEQHQQDLGEEHMEMALFVLVPVAGTAISASA